MTASEQRKFRTFPKRALALTHDATFNRLRHKPADSHLSRRRNLAKKTGPTPYSARYNPRWMTEMRRLTSKPRAIESLTGSTLNDRSNKQVNVIAAHSRKREANKRQEYDLKPIRHIWKRQQCWPDQRNAAVEEGSPDFAAWRVARLIQPKRTYDPNNQCRPQHCK
jgi:hypothetical protein